MSPLSVSSMGELKRSPLSIGSRGELTLVTLVPVDDIRRGGSSGLKLMELQRINREDEEILAIIMASLDLLE